MRDEASPSPAETVPSIWTIFVAFFATSALGFGGVMPWARRMLVERRRWLSAEEFNDQLSLCQFLPGSNVVNMAVVVGTRYHGFAGALAAFLGIMAAPSFVVMGMGWLYLRFGGLATVQGALAGIAASAAGLIVANAAKIATPLLKRRPAQALPFILMVFAAVALMHWPLEWVVLAFTPLSIAASWRWPS